MASKTLTAQVADLTALVEQLLARGIPAGTPATGSAEAPLYVSDKARCAVHSAAACTRKLSNPEGSHVACNGTGAAHDKLRASHRHF